MIWYIVLSDPHTPDTQHVPISVRDQQFAGLCSQHSVHTQIEIIPLSHEPMK